MEHLANDIINDIIEELRNLDFDESDLKKAREGLRKQLGAGHKVIVIYVCPDNREIQVEPQKLIYQYHIGDDHDYCKFASEFLVIDINGRDQTVYVYKD